MNQKKYLILLVTLLLLSSCGKEVSPETTTDAKKEVQADIQNEISGSTLPTTNREDLPTPIPVSTKTKDGISTRFVEPTTTDVSGSGKVNTSGNKDSSLKVNKINKTYRSPGGNDEVSFTITTNGGKIENVKTETVQGGEISQKMQKLFGDAINAQVSGKTLEEAKNVKAVGGASLTTRAFVEALKSL